MRKAIVWIRRDLRLEDHKGIEAAYLEGYQVQLLFIFDDTIIGDLPSNDPRLSFIYDELYKMNESLKTYGASILVYRGKVKDVWNSIFQSEDIAKVFWNKDFEPYSITRDQEIKQFLAAAQIPFSETLDHILFEPNAILKADGSPYTVYTPYKNKWLAAFERHSFEEAIPIDTIAWNKSNLTFPSRTDLKLQQSTIKVEDFSLDHINIYGQYRDYPSKEVSTKLGPHLRFGTVSIRKLLKAYAYDEVFLSELIWRSFFIQILYHFPKVVTDNFKAKYDAIVWRNNEQEFDLWKEGKTGYPIVDAGMRELKETGYMHNRVRMICASFLVKHLLIDWRWGEAYFADKLLDFELASNNGNWQWVAGTGCDAAPYFRVFNPIAQQEKFDKNMEYIRKWVPEIFTSDYPKEIVDHKLARERVILAYKVALNKNL